MDFVYFLGRFHVLVLHLPIGMIVALFVLEYLSRKERYRYLEAASPYLWGATAISALVTVLLGFMHFAEGSFTGPSAEQHRFFGTVSRGLATVIEKAVSNWGLPNGYILGQEAGGAFVAGLRYGEGTLYTRNAGDRRVFWQGPSIGFDWGGEGARTMILVYHLPATDAIYQRFAGIDGSAYFVGGFGMTALGAGNIVLVPIRSGVGLRLGANIGYLHFTRAPTWNPF